MDSILDYSGRLVNSAESREPTQSGGCVVDLDRQQGDVGGGWIMQKEREMQSGIAFHLKGRGSTTHTQENFVTHARQSGSEKDAEIAGPNNGNSGH
jgi:hypothetical protein